MSALRPQVNSGRLSPTFLDAVRQIKFELLQFTNIHALLRSLDVSPEPVFKRTGFVATREIHIHQLFICGPHAVDFKRYGKGFLVVFNYALVSAQSQYWT